MEIVDCSFKDIAREYILMRRIEAILLRNLNPVTIINKITGKEIIIYLEAK